MRTGRLLQVARCGYGAALIAAPELVLRAAAHRPVERRVAAVARVLGARNVGQALITGPAPGPTALRLGIAVDALHAASMLTLAAADRQLRGLALRSAGVAAGWGAAAALAARLANRGS